MDYLIKISQLNDFIFCPYSIYLHNVYDALDDRQFHDVPQTKGRQAHETVDNGSYSSKANVLTGMMVYSETYGLIGKIDQFFIDDYKLVERKRTIKTIYDGYKLQLYAQYFCLLEMGYRVDKLLFHSMTDNKNYPLLIPTSKTDDVIVKWFEAHLTKVRAYSPAMALNNINVNKCKYCIYHSLCDQTSYRDNDIKNKYNK